jgi:hypothetical protein
MACDHPGLLDPTIRLLCGSNIHEPSTTNIVTDDVSARSRPDVHIGRHMSRRQPFDWNQGAPTHIPCESRSLRTMNCGANERANAVAANDEIGFFLLAIGEGEYRALIG